MNRKQKKRARANKNYQKSNRKRLEILGRNECRKFQGYSLVEMKDHREKYRWVSKFSVEYYKGEKITHEDIFTGAKFYLCKSDDEDVGYIRIVNKTKEYLHLYDGEVWSISEAYVLPNFRHKGILSYMTKQILQQDPNVKRMYILKDRLKKYRKYYRCLGFTYNYTVPGMNMAIAYVTSFKDIAKMKMKSLRFDKKTDAPIENYFGDMIKGLRR